MYELRGDMAKIWRSALCDFHEKIIASFNVELKKAHKIKEFRETNE